MTPPSPAPCGRFSSALAMAVFLAILIGGSTVIYIYRNPGAPIDESGFDLSISSQSTRQKGAPIPASNPVKTAPSSLEMFKAANRLPPSAPSQPKPPSPAAPSAALTARPSAAAAAPRSAATMPVYPHLKNRPGFGLGAIGAGGGTPSEEDRRARMSWIISNCMHYHLNDAPPRLPSANNLNVSLNYEYYDVAGTTDKQICEDIARHKTPPNMDMKGWASLIESRSVVVVAFTRWAPLKPRMSWRQTSRSCEIQDASVDVNITISLPRWNQRGDAELVDRWNRMLAAVTYHEQTHAAIAVQGGLGLLQELESLQVPRCDAAQQALDGSYRGWHGDTVLKQQNFDRQTSQNERADF